MQVLKPGFLWLVFGGLEVAREPVGKREILLKTMHLNAVFEVFSFFGESTKYKASFLAFASVRFFGEKLKKKLRSASFFLQFSAKLQKIFQFFTYKVKNKAYLYE